MVGVLSLILRCRTTIHRIATSAFPGYDGIGRAANGDGASDIGDRVGPVAAKRGETGVSNAVAGTDGTRAPLAAHGLCAVLVWAAVSLPALTRAWRPVGLALYDLPNTFDPLEAQDTPLVIVAVDEPQSALERRRPALGGKANRPAPARPECTRRRARGTVPERQNSRSDHDAAARLHPRPHRPSPRVRSASC